MGAAPGIKLGRTDTTNDLSHNGKGSWRGKLGERGGRGVYIDILGEGMSQSVQGCFGWRITALGRRVFDEDANFESWRVDSLSLCCDG